MCALSQELEKVLKQSIKTVDDAHSRRDGELENNLSATRDEVMAMCVQVQQQQTDGVRTLDAAVSAASKQAVSMWHCTWQLLPSAHLPWSVDCHRRKISREKLAR
jgi:ElaB/YqjD/DUF883 family membrane-anchored ribosome-binding protein